MHVTQFPVRTLANFTSLALIIPSLQGRTTRAVIHELADALHRVEGVIGHLSPSLAALNSELLTSRTLDSGAACPHITLPAVNHPRFALGRSTEPLRWRASSYPPIEFVFLIVKPVKESDESRPFSAALNRLRKDTARLNKLRMARDAQEMLAVLAQCPIATTGRTANT